MVRAIELPLIGPQAFSRGEASDGVVPVREETTCGTGWVTSCEGSSLSHLSGNARRLEVPFASRRLNLDAIPSTGMLITTIDMDLTVECNLRCTYCFKEKWNEHMEEQVAFDAIVWLIHASGDAKELHISLMGGEPLLRFKLIKKLVPFAKRRAVQHGKTISFGITTNGTLVTDEVVEFWRRWDMGFHTSIDGPPDVQDRNRPTTSGKGSARLVEKSAKRILRYRRNTTARCTVVPGSAGNIVESYKYFRSIGYEDIAFVPGGYRDWDEASLRLFEDQFRQVADLLMADLRAGRRVVLKGVDEYANARVRQYRFESPCGAARGTVLIDIHGDIWPCHRWNKESEATWRLGSIYEQFDDAARAPLDVPSFITLLKNDCSNCPANQMCSGGCPAENLEDTGSVYRRPENACRLTRVFARVGQIVYETMTAEQNQTFLESYCSNEGFALGFQEPG